MAIFRHVFFAVHGFFRWDYRYLATLIKTSMSILDFAKKKKNQLVGSYNNDASSLGFVKNTVKGLGNAFNQVVDKGPAAAYYDANPKAALNTKRASIARFPEELAGNLFSGVKSFAKTAGSAIGESLAYNLDKNVREQYDAGNTDILPTTSKVKPLQMFGSTVRAGLEVATPKFLSGAMKAKAIPSTATTLQKFGEYGKRALSAAPAGYAYDVSNKVAEGAKLNEGKTYDPGVGTAMSALFGAGARPALDIVKADTNVQAMSKLPSIFAKAPAAIRNTIANRKLKPVTETIPSHWRESGKELLKTGADNLPERAVVRNKGDVLLSDAEYLSYPKGRLADNERFSSHGIDIEGKDAFGSPQFSIKKEQFVPEQTLDRTPWRVPSLRDWIREVGGALPRMGNSIQDVSVGKNLLPVGKTDLLLLPKGRYTANTPAEAKRLFRKTGDAPSLAFRGRERKTPIALPEQIGDILPNSQQAKSILRKTGVVTDFQNIKSDAKPTQLGMSDADIFRKKMLDIGKEKPLPRLTAGRYTASTPREAKQILKRTGQVPEFQAVRSGGETIIPRPNVAEMPMTKIADVERTLYGNEAIARQDGRNGVGMTGNLLRKGESAVDEGVSRMLSSNNATLRSLANTLRGFGGAFGKSEDLQRNIAKYRGGIDYGQKLAQDIRKAVPNDAKSLERIHSNLDPELYGGKIAKLTPEEEQSVGVLRLVSDFINDTNYKNGLISEETWIANRGGKYITRAYEPYDMPPEVADFMKQANAKFDLNPFKQREGLNDWKVENAIKDPAYLVGKRLQQTVFNDSVKKMFGWLKDKPQFVSDAPRGGYTQLSDHKAFGDLAGKFVRKDVLEGVKGLYFEHQALQNVYDALKWYDRNPLRRGLKQTKTLYNPAVRIGNNVGNYVFGWLSGVNPFTFTKNQVIASRGIKRNDPLALRLHQDGILGGGTHKGDIVQMAQELAKGVQDSNVLMKLKKTIEDSYVFVDDRAKYAAVKTFLDRGLSYEEATRRAMRGFQNYATVGWMYDVASKLPVFGNPFIRFAGSLASILKSAAVDHPLRLIGTGMALKFLGDVTSMASGETPEDRETRENRVGSSHIPFTDVSLQFQTPWGEVNMARMLGVSAMTPIGGQSTASDAARFLPMNIDMNDPLRSIGGDPLVGPVISTFFDKDFRGKSISDPEQNKYKKSTLTPLEQWGNRGNYLMRQYTPPAINSVSDVNASLKGEEDFYGRTRKPKQAISSALGVKVEEYGSEQALAQREKDATYDQYARNDAKAQINAIEKQVLKGTLDRETADRRIENIQKNTPEVSLPTGIATASADNTGGESDPRISKGTDGFFRYLDASGEMKKTKKESEAKLAVQKMDFEDSGENFRDAGDFVLRRNPDGTVKAQKKTEYTDDLLYRKMNMAKDAKNYDEWKKLANDKYTLLTQMMEDPSLDDLERLDIQDKIDTLTKEASKYSTYGGQFTKGRSGGGGSAKNPYKGLDLYDSTMNAIEMDIAGKRTRRAPSTKLLTLRSGGRNRAPRITKVSRINRK